MLIDMGEGWRLLNSSIGIRNGPFRLPLDLPFFQAHGQRACHSIRRKIRRCNARRRDGEPCRFLVFGHLVLGERELDTKSLSRPTRKPSAFHCVRPESIWASITQRCLSSGHQHGLMRLKRSAGTSCSPPMGNPAWGLCVVSHAGPCANSVSPPPVR